MMRRSFHSMSFISKLSETSMKPCEPLARFNALSLLSAFAAVALLTSSCTNPIGANHASVRVAYAQASDNALKGGLSAGSKLILHRYNMTEKYDANPIEALKALHDRACSDNRRDLLFALSELSFAEASRLERSPKLSEPKFARDYYLDAAIYAYYYLLGQGNDPPPDKFDRRFRDACELYNIGLAKGLGAPKSTNAVVLLEDSVRQLPPGQVDIHLNTNSFPFPMEWFDKFLSADQYLVRGMSVRTRLPGLGAPLIGVSKVLPELRFRRSTPVTIFAHVPGDVRAWSQGKLALDLDVYSGYGDGTVKVGDTTLPLEADLTAPLAYSLNDSFVWGLGMGQFFSSVEKIKSDVYMSQPYQPGRVPVVFVHGTFSSPVWWAEMMNTLRADPEIRKRCQLWFFIYNSGNPVVYSANALRDALTAKVKQLDPEGKDPALQQMVVIGHSQGGLLTKLTVTDSGDKLWKSLGVKSLDDPRIEKKQLDLFKRYTVYEPLPFVKRVVFISTPHRGSYLASNFARKIAQKFVTLPKTVMSQAKELAGLKEKLKIEGISGLPTSLDSMSTSNKFLLALADIPPGPGVKCNSIIAVQGTGDYHEGKDGLVAYPSAHVNYAESEFIVRSFHSCQDKPPTIEEVRRILLKHLKELPPNVAPGDEKETSAKQ
jgi:pimeloyl-ACP methyl ester carboxylesterase